MSQNSSFLSSAHLKDHAKDALEGKYRIMILATILIGILTLVSQGIVDFIALTLFKIVLITREAFFYHLPLDQINLLINDKSYLQSYTTWYSVLSYAANLAVNAFTTVFNVGLSLICLNIACGQLPKLSDIFYGFQNQFSKSLKLSAVYVLVNELCYLPANILLYLIREKVDQSLILITILIFALCLVLFLVLNLAISQSFLLLLDFPDYGAGKLIQLSTHIMKGHKLRLFRIQLSFLPLILLSILTLGIGNLWLLPYMDLTYTFFFLNLMQARESES